MDSRFMARALALAVRAKGRTSPNPLVGAVIVKSGKKIAEGYHKKAGEKHAEIIALEKAGPKAVGAEMYVTLEPCCHTGRTGPCATAIIEAGIKKVFVAMRDPNPLVAGKGIARLKKAGIKVSEGIMREQAKEVNAAFLKFINRGLPYVTLKAACSLDGKIAAEGGDSQWISNAQSRKLVHEMRSESDAILIGVNTLLRDNPRLNVRPAKKGAKQPIRVVVDTSLKSPPDARIFSSRGGRVIIATSRNASEKRAKALEKRGAEIVRLRERKGVVSLKALMKSLAKSDVVTVLLEGGSTLYSEALSLGLVDRAAIFFAPLLIGGSDRFSVFKGKGVRILKEALRIDDITFRKLGDNIYIEGNIKPCSPE